MNEAGETSGTRVGHLTLYCEDLMGIPVISAVLVHISYEDSVKLAKQANKGMWNFSRETINFHKDSYLFNSPSLQNNGGVNDIQKLLQPGQEP